MSLRLLFAALLTLMTLGDARCGEATPRSKKSPETAKTQSAALEEAKAIRQRILRDVLLDHFFFGLEAPREWHAEVRTQHGARFDFLNAYLSAGVGKGDPWFFTYSPFVSNRIAECGELGMGAWFTWYMLSQSMPADYKPGPAEAAPVNARVPETMREYFTWFARTLDECAKHPDVPIVMQIEPDEWNHLLIAGGMDPAKAVVMVGSCGHPELAGLPDNLFGYAKAMARLRDAHAPRVLLATNPSGWDWRGSMSGARMGATFKALCGEDYELAAFEFGDRDKGVSGKRPPYADQSGICETFPNHLAWVRDFHEASGLWVAMWQVAMGNTVYASCDDTPGHHTDNLAQFVLEGYPRNDGIARYVAAGCCGWVFNGGQGDSTQAHDARKDGITNPTAPANNRGEIARFADDDGGFMRLAAAAYYKDPFPILAKPKPKAKEEKAAKPKPAPRAKPVLVDESALTAMRARLHALLGEALARDRAIAFTPSGLRDPATLEAIAGDHLDVRMDAGRIRLAWGSLKPHDLAQLAAAIVRDGEAETYAVSAFFLLYDGQPERADEPLRRAGERAEAVRAAFAAP
ncbi:MAG TPA: hypothetical protein VEL07_03135 [Planctomycetota bacterium]|nr:hypothetical protein [Planctomycetota bacterium]